MEKILKAVKSMLEETPQACTVDNIVSFVYYACKKEMLELQQLEKRHRRTISRLNRKLDSLYSKHLWGE